MLRVHHSKKEEKRNQWQNKRCRWPSLPRLASVQLLLQFTTHLCGVPVFQVRRDSQARAALGGALFHIRFVLHMHSSISILRGQEHKQSRWRNPTDTDADSRGEQIQTSVKIRTAALARMKKKIGVEYAKRSTWESEETKRPAMKIAGLKQGKFKRRQVVEITSQRRNTGTITVLEGTQGLLLQDSKKYWEKMGVWLRRVCMVWRTANTRWNDPKSNSTWIESAENQNGWDDGLCWRRLPWVLSL